MLDLGFFEDVEKILARCPGGRQTALFSATMPPPIKKLAESGMYDPVTIKVKAATLTIDTVEQFFVEASDRDKPDALAEVLKAERPEQAIIFVRTKIGADRLSRRLNDKGVRVKALHGDMSQGSRDGVMIAFKGGRDRLLVATDIAARGLDISGVSHVINYDLPNSPEVYVHRIGRTGRVGRSGRAITLITPKQQRDLEAIRKHANTDIEPWSATTNGDRPQVKVPPVESEPPRDEELQPRRPRHTKPRRAPDQGARAKLIVGAGLGAGLEPKDVIEAIVANTELDGEDVQNVRMLERFSFVEVPRDRADDVVAKVNGKRVRDVPITLEVAGR
jgi:ATP-dependent RNA helicase DeaD